MESDDVDLLLLFGVREILSTRSLLDRLTENFPNAAIAGCSTAGEIHDGTLEEHSLAGVALSFESASSRTEVVKWRAKESGDHEALGRAIAERMGEDDLRCLLLFADGLMVDADDLISGVENGLDRPEVIVVGGLAGDQLAFGETLVLDRAGATAEAVVACGVYGAEFELETASSLLSPPSIHSFEVTSADGNLIREIDHRPAVEVFAEVVGCAPEDLPRYLVRFPLKVNDGTGRQVLRTPHSIHFENQYVYMAGTVQEGPAEVADFSDPKWITQSAHEVGVRVFSGEADFCLVVNCAGRRANLGPMAGHEIDALNRANRGSVPMTGFYGYGEFGEAEAGAGRASLLNHTLTALSIREA